MDKNVVKNWFKSRLKPSQSQFWQWIDACFFVGDKLPLDDVEGLDDALNGMQLQVNGVSNALPLKADLIAVTDALNNKYTKNELVAINRGLSILNAHAFEDNTNLNVVAEQGLLGYCSYDVSSLLSGTMNVKHINGYQSRISYNNTATLDSTTGYNFQFANTGAGIVNHLKGMFIQAPTGGGTILDKKAIEIEDYSGGYSIYSAGGENYFAGKVTAQTVRIMSLNPGEIPYHKSVPDGLSKSPIFTDGTRVSIGGTSLFRNYKTEIVGDVLSLFLADNITANTTKVSRIAVGVYDITKNPMGVIYTIGTNTQNILNIGGGTSLFSAPTNIFFYTADTVGVNYGTKLLELKDKEVAIGNNNATSLITQVNSPIFRITANAWNGSTSRSLHYLTQVIATPSADPISSYHKWSYQLDGTTLANLMFLTNTGDLSLGGLPNANAILDIQSSYKGILIPRLSTTNINLILAEAMQAYDVTVKGLKLHNGANWNNIVHANVSNAKVAGTPTPDGYIEVTIGGVNFKLMTTT